MAIDSVTSTRQSRAPEGRLTRIYRKLTRHEIWNIGLVFDPIHRFLEPDYRPTVRWLPVPPPGCFVADPFGVENEGRICLLYEGLDYRDNKGRIDVALVDRSGVVSHSETAMEFPFHASYPFLVRHEGRIYCIPETNAAREVSIFLADPFPYRWTRVGTLLDGVAAVDSTIFRHNGVWWLFFTDQDSDQNSMLRIRYAPDLFGPWKPHALDPAKCDSATSRPGGTPFEYDGALYRPAQDCTRTYGGRVIINRVIELTPTSFVEEPASIVSPLADSPYPDGLHTISSVGEVTVIDAKKTAFVSQAFGWLIRDAIRSRRRGPRR